MENQNYEWKSKWNEEFLKELCGFANDGRLPENWTVADLLKRHRSRPFNPKIANAFYSLGYIETWGRGIEKITSNCKEAGKPIPLFEASQSEVIVTFYLIKEENSNVETDVETGSDVENDVETDVENISISAVQSRILEMMRLSPTISTETIAKEIGRTPRNVQVHIKKLKETGAIVRSGAAKGGHWKVISPKNRKKNY